MCLWLVVGTRESYTVEEQVSFLVKYLLNTDPSSASGIILSARLKALGVDSVIVDRNPQAGDNWALRYDCLRFHISRQNCETPYLRVSHPEPLFPPAVLV